MSYIGNTATTQAFTPAVDYFSGNGSTTAFTLSRPVASVAQVEAVIDNVVKNPSSAYTVSGNTITFTSAPLSGTNNIYVRYTSPITQVIAPGQGTVNIAAFNATGTPSSSTYLRGDNTWSTVSGGVTSATAGTGISVSGATGAVTFTNTGVTSLTTSSGLSTNTSATGAVSVTNTGVTSVVAGTGISVSSTTGAVVVSATGGGTVTSIATGNGLQGGTITTSGTLSIAAPAFNTVGSSCQGGIKVGSSATFSATGGDTFSPGTGNGQLQAVTFVIGGNNLSSNTLSGSWRYMGATGSAGQPACGPFFATAIFYRIS